MRISLSSGRDFRAAPAVETTGENLTSGFTDAIKTFSFADTSVDIYTQEYLSLSSTTSFQAATSGKPP
ncbi:hypothetical protein AYI68_g6129 [Smittium mucronatum]|uniref:Uncharacterized protein n=1 Tax=Smittium mucronatum TaxID=133383 RepID=A0A1R0GSD0_9FUNG|nr:hypothetical protein AYI68_g6129 [Smittium mucronatum]